MHRLTENRTMLTKLLQVTEETIEMNLSFLAKKVKETDLQTIKTQVN